MSINHRLLVYEYLGKNEMQKNTWDVKHLSSVKNVRRFVWNTERFFNVN